MSDRIDVNKLDAETLAIMRGYAGSGFADAKEVLVEIEIAVDGESWSLSDFEAVVRDAINRVPRNKRAEAHVVLRGGYDESTSLEITYRDIESDDVVQKRISECLAYARRVQAGERRTYEALKKKFEG